MSTPNPTKSNSTHQRQGNKKKRRTRNCGGESYHKWRPQHIQWMIDGHTMYPNSWEKANGYMNDKSREQGQGEPFKTAMVKAYWRFLRIKQEKEEARAAGGANGGGGKVEEDDEDEEEYEDEEEGNGEEEGEGEMGMFFRGSMDGREGIARGGYELGNASTRQGSEGVFGKFPERRMDLDAVFSRNKIDRRPKEQRYEEPRNVNEQQGNFVYRKGMTWRPGMTWNGALISEEDFQAAEILLSLSMSGA
ncbi:hypothetical protein HYFRA_00005113 [Hymenoscyphus fraxineus]|uniref:Uncharacterized protein n=1 Tax=Hymenoscyphus fraxineus TaxID=746836 RepID=A0A9N9LD83_9HELO|nr:hypothetical protein HYFRA_00005113 [Hymenoscyphus fraxineus]